MNRSRAKCFGAVFLGAAACLAAGSPAPAPVTFTPETGRCLACHVREAPTAPSPEGPEIDIRDFALSPHARLGCRPCHPGIDPAAHPEAAAAGPATLPCRDCHTRGQLAGKPIHGFLVEQATAPPCTECHAPHRMRRVADWKPPVSATMYCLTCHQRQLEVSFDGKQAFRLTIVEVARGRSVHLQHQCSDCHEKHSKLDHPLRQSDERAVGGRTFSARCASCHPEEARLFAGGLHFRLLEKGHPEAPACTDCHGFHEIEAVAQYRVLTGQPCRRCHEEVFAQFRESHHARTGTGYHLDLPLCSSCHRAHDLAFESLAANVNEACLGCHDDAEFLHRTWLPKPEIHFTSVSCPACHAPSLAGSMTVAIIDTRTGKRVARAAAGAIVGKAYATLLAENAACSTDLALWSDLILEMNRRAAQGRPVYTFRIEAPDGGMAHRMGGREEACRECARCHRQCLELIDRSWRFPH